MKPFNLEEAKAGKPVCTRDGRKAKIICFNDNNPLVKIIALVTQPDGFDYHYLYLENGKNIILSETMNRFIRKTINLAKGACWMNDDSADDLVMEQKSQKKKLWIGIEKVENSFGVHSTTVGFEDIKYLTLDNLDDYKIVEIEINI